MRTKKFDVLGMSCAACVSHVEKAVSNLDGVRKVQVNLLTNSMIVDFDEKKQNASSIEEAVEKGGYAAQLQEEKTEKTRQHNYIEDEFKNLQRRWWTSVCFLIPLLYLSMGHMLGFPLPDFFLGNENAMAFAFTQFLLTFPIAFINKKYFTSGFKMLFKRKPNMDSLIAIGSSAAILYGIYAIYKIGYGLGHGNISIVQQFSHDLYFESGATILTLITLGKYLEAKSKRKTSDAITKLIDLAPKTATVIRNNQEMNIPVEELLPGDFVVVKAGQQIPVDGLIESGEASIDESALTGESFPVFKREGDKVLSASINKSGFIILKATKVGKDTTLSQIIALVEEAASSKAPISKLADKISGIFVPFVILIAILSMIVWLLVGYPFDFALSIAIAVLVISCPCALGLATPVAIMVGTGKGAEHGILVKSAEALEKGHAIDTVVLDKTGTLTEGKPQLTDIVLLSDEINEKDLLKIAFSLEKLSEHPLANAIMSKAETEKIVFDDVQNFETIPGKGIQGVIGTAKYLIGNDTLMKENNINIDDETAAKIKTFAEQGKTPLLISDNTKLLGIISAADILKKNSKEAIEELKKMGMEVIMLTGDNAKTAKAIQNELKLNNIIAEVLPQDKDAEINRLQQSGKKVAMIGDGINDAPALTRADVGIAIGAGSDIAIESADIVLIKNNLLDSITAFRLSKAVMKNIKQNLFWAFFYNIIGIPLAAGVFYSILGWKLSPMFAAAAMSLSSVTVVANALRLRKFKSYKSKNKSDIIKALNVEENKMEEKTMKVKGMSCMHCSNRVEKALNAISGVEAKVNLAENEVQVKLTRNLSNEELKKAVEDAGYEVASID